MNIIDMKRPVFI